MTVRSWAEDNLLQQIFPNSFRSSEKGYFSPECILALLKYRIKLLFFFFLNGTNQLNTMKGAVEKLLCNFKKPCNPDLTVGLARGALSPNLLSVHLQGGRGGGRRCEGTHLPS